MSAETTAGRCDRPEHAALTPRDHLQEHLYWGCVGPEQMWWLVDTVLDEHAHQLAERQREAIRQTDDPVFYDGEAGWLPNLIDPAVASP